jgi:hypothetical protein
MFTRVMRRPPVQRPRPVELSKEAQAIAKASVSASAKVEALPSFDTCKGCVAKKMCKSSGCCMYGQTKPKEKSNAKNG